MFSCNNFCQILTLNLQVCINTQGSFTCSCNTGYSLKSDNRSCALNQNGDASLMPSSSNNGQFSPAHRSQSEITAYHG